MDDLALPRVYLEGDEFRNFLDGVEKALEPALAETAC